MEPHCSTIIVYNPAVQLTVNSEMEMERSGPRCTSQSDAAREAVLFTLTLNNQILALLKNRRKTDHY